MHSNPHEPRIRKQQSAPHIDIKTKLKGTSVVLQNNHYQLQTVLLICRFISKPVLSQQVINSMPAPMLHALVNAAILESRSKCIDQVMDQKLKEMVDKRAERLPHLFAEDRQK